MFRKVPKLRGMIGLKVQTSQNQSPLQREAAKPTALPAKQLDLCAATLSDPCACALCSTLPVGTKQRIAPKQSNVMP